MLLPLWLRVSAVLCGFFEMHLSAGGESPWHPIPNADVFLPRPVCLVQTQSNLLEKVSAYNMVQFSQLVSAIIVKSWPMEDGQLKDDFDEILHHVLTWPDIKRIFSFNGMMFSYIYRSQRKAVLCLDAPTLQSRKQIYINCPALVLFCLKAQGVQAGSGEEGAGIPLLLTHCS